MLNQFSLGLPKEVRKCETKHWFSCSADGRSLGTMGLHPHARKACAWSSAIKLTSDLQIAHSFIVRKGFSHAGRELRQVEAFSVGPWERIVFAAPLQANYLIE